MDTERPKMEEFRKKGGFVHELTAEQREAWARRCAGRSGRADQGDRWQGARAVQRDHGRQEGWAEKFEKK